MIRLLKRFAVIILLATLITACEKEYSIDSLTTYPAKGSLTDSNYNCLPSIVKGAYFNGVSATADTNYVQLIVHITTVGRYKIATDTVNGFMFSDSGTFERIGYDTIQLKAKGTPRLVQSSAFMVSFDSTTDPGCIFMVAVTDSTGHNAHGHAATFTLEGAPNACTAAGLTGTYKAGEVLDNTNTATIQVNVTAIGEYTIETNTVNGYKFSASGTFIQTGLQNVTLNASGTPLAMGTDSFTPGTGSAGCSFNVTVETPSPPAAFTMAGAPNACINSTVNGSYMVNNALTTANSVVISVNVTAAGKYNLVTDTQNGMLFAATGTFTSTGIQNVTLSGAGKPTGPGSITFTPQAGASTCTFNVEVKAAPAGKLNCKIDGVYKEFNYDAYAIQFQGPRNINGSGNIAPQQPDRMGIDITRLDNTSVTTGTYVNTQEAVINSSYTAAGFYTDPSNGQWASAGAIFGTPDPFTIVITSITATNVKGTFSGTIRDQGSAGTKTKTITDGNFDLPIQ